MGKEKKMSKWIAREQKQAMGLSQIQFSRIENTKKTKWQKRKKTPDWPDQKKGQEKAKEAPHPNCIFSVPFQKLFLSFSQLLKRRIFPQKVIYFFKRYIVAYIVGIYKQFFFKSSGAFI